MDLKPPPPPLPLTPLARAKQEVAVYWRRYGSILTLIVAPMAVVAFYLFVLAQDRFQAEARFIVRTPNLGSTANIGSVLAGVQASRATDDSYAINSYIESRDALAALEKTVDVGAIFAKAGKDPLWRYPGLSGDTGEARFRQYSRLVTLSYDKNSGITSLFVQAFTPEDAAAIAGALLDNAERVANRMSARARDDAASSANRDLEAARQRAIAAIDKLTEYRNRERVVDPTRISNAVVETMSRLSLEIAQTNAQLTDLQRGAAQSPQIQTLRSRIQSLERQVHAERGQLAGSDAALAGKIAEYELLALEKEFGEKLLAAAVNSAESARLDAARQQLYVERVVNPSIADYPEAPRRFLLLSAAFFICFLVHSAYRQMKKSQFERQRMG